MAVFKLLRNFRIEWSADYDIDPITAMFRVPDKPLHFKFTDI
jgi:hypothetical protein